MRYERRTIDEELDALLPALAAVALDGPKGVGKTATASQRARSSVALDRVETMELFAAQPDRVNSLKPPVLIDEWQRLPEVWDIVRRAVDDGASPSSFLLTGSATPPSGATLHSGAGRIVSLRMRPMGLSERALTAPTVSVAELLAGGRPVLGGSCALGLVDYVREIETSGLPGIRGLPDRARRLQLDSYLTRALERDLSDEQGVTVRRPQSLRSWMVAYAAATSSTATWEVIRRAATPGDGDPPSKATSIRYRDWLSSLWLLDPLPAWLPQGTTLKGLTAGPKHHLADPALAARLMKVGANSLLDGEGRLVGARSGSALGALFESLATLTVRVCAQAAEAVTGHLRTQRGEHEVDLIVEHVDGRVLGIEVKLAASINEQDVRHLRWLEAELGDRVADLLILTTGPAAYRRADGIGVVPLGLLGA